MGAGAPGRCAINPQQPEGIAPRLAARWAAPDPQRDRALGLALWTDLMAAPLGEVFPEEAIAPVVALVVAEPVARELWPHVPRQWVEGDLERLRASGQSLGELIGEEGAERLRRLVARPSDVNPELVRRMLDQPILRQALRETLQSGLQQFITELGQSLPFGRAEVGPTGGMARGMLGELGRGLARRAADTARIGKTWAEGLGLNRAFEDQIQPFVAAWAQRAMTHLMDGLFSGDRAELAAEARVNALDILLDTSLDELIPEPDLSLIDLRLRAAEAVLGHLATADGEAEAITALVRGWRASFAKGTAGELADRLALPRVPEDALLEVIGRAAHRALARDGLAAWLEGEIRAVQEP